MGATIPPMCDSCDWHGSLREIQRLWLLKVKSPFLSNLARQLLQKHHISPNQRLTLSLIKYEKTMSKHPRYR